MSDLVRCDGDGGKRAAIKIVRTQAYSLGGRVEVISKRLGFFDFDTVQLKAFDQMIGEFPPGARQVRQRLAMLVHDLAHPE